MGRISSRTIGLAALLIGCAALAAWFRITGTTREPFWLDEGYSAYAAAKGFGFLWHVVPLYETHPPFYYSLLRLWTLGFGDSLIAHRALGVACGIATLMPLGLAAREIARRFPARFGTGAALVGAAVLLAALNRALVEMSREVRPYPVLILVYACGLAALCRLGRIAHEQGRIARGPFVAYLICLALVLWLHNLGVLYGGAMGLALLVLVLRRGLSRGDWAWLIGGHVVVALVWLPAVLILADQAPTWVHSTWLKFSWAGMPDRLLTLYAAPGMPPEPAVMAALLLLVLGLVALLREPGGGRTVAALLLLGLVPVVGSILLSVTVAPVFIVRTMTAVAVPAVLLSAVGAAGQSGPLRWIGLGAVLLLASQLVVQNIDARKGRPMQDWYGATGWLAQRFQPGDQLWAYPNEGALPLEYAVRDTGAAIAIRSIPTPIPTLDGGPGAWNPTGSRGVFSLPPAALRRIVRAPEAERVPTIWLLRLGANAYDVGDVLLGELAHDRVRTARFLCGPIDIIALSRPGPGVAASDATQRCIWPEGPMRR